MSFQRCLAWLAVALLHMSVALGAPEAARPLVLGNPDMRGMGFLAEQHLHDLQHERWNVYTQATYISVWKQAFAAKYTNLHGSPHSLTYLWRAEFHRHGNDVFGHRIVAGS